MHVGVKQLCTLDAYEVQNNEDIINCITICPSEKNLISYRCRSELHLN